MQRPAVFLSRDGVINRYAYDPEWGTFDAPSNFETFELLPGVAEAIASLNRLKIPVIVASNQPGIAKGRFTTRQLDAINEAMRVQLALSGARLDAVYYCRHHVESTLDPYRADCDCRKPKPGMLLRAARERSLDLGRSFMVGDSVPDILAGRAAGATTLFLGSPGCTVHEEFASRGAVPDLFVREFHHGAQVIIEGLFSGRPPIPDPPSQKCPSRIRIEGLSRTVNIFPVDPSRH